MTTSSPASAFAWTWLPGSTDPVVAGRIDADGPMHTFTYARSYRERPDAMSLYEPELPLRRGILRPPGGLTIAGSLRDGAPDSWVGFDVAPVRMRQVAGKDVLLVERFDRLGGGQRRHMVSALTILGLDELTGARYGSYADLADHVRRSFTSPAATLRELFARIVFNVLVGNTDDHPRNHAAFVNADGSLTPTPAYDICPQPRSVPQANQAMAISRTGERSSRLATCIESSQVYLLTAMQAREIIEAQEETIRSEWEDAADSVGLTELDRKQLFGREVLNEFAFRD